jgi:hypothetical protein
MPGPKIIKKKELNQEKIRPGPQSPLRKFEAPGFLQGKFKVQGVSWKVHTMSHDQKVANFQALRGSTGAGTDGP